MKTFQRRIFVGALVTVFALEAGLGRAQGSVTAVSVANPGLPSPIGGNSDSAASVISADGRFVLFLSSANNLVTNDSSGPWVDVFLRNRTNGTTTLVSVSASGVGGGNGHSLFPGASADGRYVVFESAASNLVANDTNNASDVFVRDLVSNTTTLVSVNPGGMVGGNGDSTSPVITPDGRYVAFASAASDLVMDDTNGIPDVFVRDLQAGITTLASPNAAAAYPGAANGSDSPVLSADGRLVVFVSGASNLVSGVMNPYSEVYVRDLLAGTTTWVSSNVPAQFYALTGASAFGTPASYNPVLSDDARFLAFKTYVWYRTDSSTSSASLIVRRDLQSGNTDFVSTNAFGNSLALSDSSGPEMTPDGRFIAFVEQTNSLDLGNVYLWDAQSGIKTLVSATPDGSVSANGYADAPAVSADGRYVAFLSDASDLVPNAVEGNFQVYLRDMQTGLTKLVSVDTDGNGSGSADASIPTLSADGRYIAFDSFDDAYVPNDNNQALDVFVRDMVSGTTELISAAGSGLQSFTGNGLSMLYDQSVSADGRFVTFTSFARNLVPSDIISVLNVFVRDLQAGTNILVSVNQAGTGSADGGGSSPVLSANGRHVAFVSSSTDLAANDTNRIEDIFVRDLQPGTTTLVSVSSDGTSGGNDVSSAPAISADGRYVAFASRATNLSPVDQTLRSDVFVRDLQTGMTTLVSVNLAGTGSGNWDSLDPLISGDGRFVVFKSLSSNLTTNSVLPIPQVYVRDLQTGSTTWLPGSTNSAYFLSANGLFLALRQESLGANWIMMRDLPTATERQISLSPVPGPSPRSADLACAVSDDGRFVAFVSRSDAIVPDDANGTNDVFVCDLETFTITLVSLNREGTGSANGRSDSPAISANGRFVAYRSYATDIVPGDDNSQPDIFLFDRQTGMNRLVSANRAGLGSGNGLSGTPVISANGSALFFRSLASDLAAGDYNETQDVFHYTVAAAAPADSDGDGMADAWEQSLFGDLSKNGLADTDGDGLSDLVEYKVWSNPTDPNSSFRGEIAGPSVSSEITVSWNAAPGRMYRVQYKNDLSETTWKDFGGTIAVGGSRASIVENMAGLVNQRFYRVTLVE